MVYLSGLVKLWSKEGWNNENQFAALMSLQAEKAGSEVKLPLVKTINEYIENKSKVIFLGESGSGKTYTLKAMLSIIAKGPHRANIRFWSFALLSITILIGINQIVIAGIVLLFLPLWEKLFRRFPIPIYIEGHLCEENYSFQDLIKKNLKKTAGHYLARYIDELISSKRLVILLDGLNEIEGSLYSSFISGLRTEFSLPLSRYNQIPIVLTGQQETSFSEYVPLSCLGMDIYTISELNTASIKKFLEVFGVDDPGRIMIKLEANGFLESGGLGRIAYWLEKTAQTRIFENNPGTILNGFVDSSIKNQMRNPQRAYQGYCAYSRRNIR